MTIIREDIVEFIEVEYGISGTSIEDHTLLFSSGMIDSFALIALISFVENRCDIRISPMDVTLDNLDSVDRILCKICSVNIHPLDSQTLIKQTN